MFMNVHNTYTHELSYKVPFTPCQITSYHWLHNVNIKQADGSLSKNKAYHKLNIFIAINV